MFEIKGKSKKANIGISIRFTDELYEDLKKYAADNNVSFNYLVLQCCEYALDNKK